MADKEITAVLKLKDELSAKIQTTNKSLNQLNTRVQKSNDRLTQIGKNTGFVRLATAVAGAQAAMRGFTAVTRAVVSEFGAAIEASSRATEVNNLFETSFGELAGAAEDWAERTQQAIGVNDTTLKEMSGTLYNMVTAMGIGKEAAFDMATGMTELALDTSSFFNLPFDRAFTVIQAGLAGETEGLRRLGVDITETSLKQLDYVKAIEATGRELTQTEKVTARSIAIQEGLKNAQGDLIRTQDSWANQTRLVGEAWTDLREELGLAMTDNEAIAEIIEFTRDAIIDLTDALKDNKDAFKIFVADGVRFAVGYLKDFLGALAAVSKANDTVARIFGGTEYRGLTEALERASGSLEKLEQRLVDASGAAREGDVAARTYVEALRRVDEMGREASVMFDVMMQAGYTAEEALAKVSERVTGAAPKIETLNDRMSDVNETLRTLPIRHNAWTSEILASIPGVDGLNESLGENSIQWNTYVEAVKPARRATIAFREEAQITSIGVSDAFRNLASNIGGSAGEVISHVDRMTTQIQSVQSIGTGSALALGLAYVNMGFAVGAGVAYAVKWIMSLGGPWLSQMIDRIINDIRRIRNEALETQAVLADLTWWDPYIYNPSHLPPEVPGSSQVPETGTSGPPPLPEFQHGGYIPASPPRGRLAILGEREGEYVIPESKMGAMGGGSMTVTVPMTIVLPSGEIWHKTIVRSVNAAGRFGELDLGEITVDPRA